MQISTRGEDFLVDTIALRNELHVLQGVFTNPQVVKVLHGADRDILWLQRSSNKWVHASAVLTECSALSLNVATSKRFAYDARTGVPTYGFLLLC